MNCRKLRLSLLVVGLCLSFIFISRVDGQLNFSTGWGKRSAAAAAILRNSNARTNAFNAQADADLLLRFFRHLKKIEAQRFANTEM